MIEKDKLLFLNCVVLNRRIYCILSKADEFHQLSILQYYEL